MPNPIFARARSVARRLVARSSGAAPATVPLEDATPTAASEHQPPAAYRAAATPTEIVALRAELAAALELRARGEKENPHGR